MLLTVVAAVPRIRQFWFRVHGTFLFYIVRISCREVFGKGGKIKRPKK